MPKTLNHPAPCAFRVTDTAHPFESARDAIDAASAFEAATGELWEYELRAVDEVHGLPVYEARVARLASNGTLRPLRGFLAPVEAAPALPAEITVAGYRVTLERCADDNDPARGSWVDCWVTSKGGGQSNSLSLLADLGAFDDGPKISAPDLAAIERTARAYGWEG